MLSEKNQRSIIKELISYTYPKLYCGLKRDSEWYVGFYAFDPAIGKLRRKKIKINYITKVSDRRKYAAALIHRVSMQLDKGWNPWIESAQGKAYHKFSDVCESYRRFITKMYSDGTYREETYIGYASYLRNMESWNANQSNPITYIYQFESGFISEFLDHIFIERDNSIQTRNNYLTFLRIFSSWLVQHQYLKNKPTDGVISLGRRSATKNRTIINEKDVVRLHEYLQERNQYFLLACYILHYALIRPKEMSKLKLNDFNLNKQTIHVSELISKNKKAGVVTIPVKVIHLMLDLDVFSNPGDFYLFSDNFKPGASHRDEKQFRDYWHLHIRPDLKFPSSYKFYSLKDTGITEMLRTCDPITVRDQARHSDITMTNTYTPANSKEANHLLINYKGTL